MRLFSDNQDNNSTDILDYLADDVEYVPAHVKVPMDVWQEIVYDLRRLAELDVEMTQRREDDRKYLSWSLGGGMAQAVLAGRQSVEGNDDE
jgi:hypothetical protein